MAASPIPVGGITLHAPNHAHDTPKPNYASSISLKLADDIVQDIKRASREKNGVQFVTGRFPKLRIGHTTIDLTLSPDQFHNELYSTSPTGGPAEFDFNGIISHRAEVKTASPKDNLDNTGSDAALAALQNSLASYEQEKQAKQTNITDSVLAIPKNRFEAARKQKLDARRGRFSSSASPSIHGTQANSLGLAPTSVPASEGAARTQAMKTPLTHLLAIRPITLEDVIAKTHIPKHDLESLLQKIGKQADGKWLLTDRAYKELDVWKFGYKSTEERQSAIDNAIRAYDRLRLGKEDALWQQLLPKTDRGKGIVLSRLNLAASQASRGLTPHHLPSPTPHTDGVTDSKPASAANTPRLGGVTPKTGPKPGGIMKRLLSKDPSKARAQEDAKEKKRKAKEMDAEPSDRESSRVTAKRVAVKKTTTKYKSAELVHSSSDESDGEIVEDSRKRTESKINAPRAPVNAKTRPTTTATEKSDTAHVKRPAENVPSKVKEGLVANKATTSADKNSRLSLAGKRTPLNTKNNSLSAPTSSTKNQPSPQRAFGKPTVPSPLGAAKPRTSESDRATSNLQQSRPRVGVDTPKGLGITNGSRKRHDTITSTDSAISSGSDDKSRLESRKTAKPVDSVRPRQSLANGTAKQIDQRTKRKSEHLSSLVSDGPAQKYRKTESGWQKPLSRPGSMAQSNRPSHGSPDGIFDSSDSGTSASDNSVTYYQGVNMAQKFRDVYYPAYAKMYDDQAAKELRGESVTKTDREKLWNLHKRLEQMKHDIQLAAQRQHQPV